MQERPGGRRGHSRSPAAVIAVTVLVAVLFVALSLRRPAVEAFAPTPVGGHEVGDELVGPARYTVDASSPGAWRFFDFSRGSVVSATDPAGWDLAFRRFNVLVNGGAGFAGRGGVIDLGEVEFGEVREAPSAGYVPSVAGRDSSNAAIARWYVYGWTSHLLNPKPNVYVVRTADGRYAKIRFLSYYCPGAVPGCLTFEYVYQGSGARSFEADSGKPAAES